MKDIILVCIKYGVLSFLHYCQGYLEERFPSTEEKEIDDSDEERSWKIVGEECVEPRGRKQTCLDVLFMEKISNVRKVNLNEVI